MNLNNRQRESYNKLLGYLEKRAKQRGIVAVEEKQLMNILKVIIDGGWVINEAEFKDVLEMISVTSQDDQKRKM